MALDGGASAGQITPELHAAFADPSVRAAHVAELIALAAIVALMVLSPSDAADATRASNQPLPGAPDPWAPSTMPPFRSRPPYVMSEMIAAEPAVAERLLRRLAKDSAFDALTSEIRATIDAGRPGRHDRLRNLEHAAMAIASLVSDALDLPAGHEFDRSRRSRPFRVRRGGAASAVSHEGGTRRNERGDPRRGDGRWRRLP